MAVEIKNLSIKVQVNGNTSQVSDDEEAASKWSQEELIELNEKNLNKQKER